MLRSPKALSEWDDYQLLQLDVLDVACESWEIQKKQAYLSMKERVREDSSKEEKAKKTNYNERERERERDRE